VDGLEGYLDRLASAEPTPGGGSAAAVVAAAGAALVAMVARITLGSARLAERHPAAEVIAEQADALRAELLGTRLADESAYGEVVAAMALPKGSDEEKHARTNALQRALALAAAEPLRIAELAGDAVALAEQALGLHNRNLVSDVGCAAEFAAAGLAAAALNVRINHRYLKDATVVADQGATLTTLERDTAARLERLRECVQAEMKA